MTIWVDSQLPPALAPWLKQQFGVEAASLESLGLRGALDADIFQRARQPGCVVMTKDDDFVDLVTRLGPPPQILWVTCGNVTNRRCRICSASRFRPREHFSKRANPSLN